MNKFFLRTQAPVVVAVLLVVLAFPAIGRSAVVADPGAVDGEVEAGRGVAISGRPLASVISAGLGCLFTDCALDSGAGAGRGARRLSGAPSERGALTFALGHRTDQLFWNIDGGPGGVNILSELTWTDLKSVQARLNYRTWSPGGLYFRSSAAYGVIYAGDNQDSDYNGNDRTLEYSRSNNVTDSGSLFDASGAVGFIFRPRAWFTAAPLVGYSYHAQNLNITDGFQTIPATGAFSNLHSTYEASWRGLWVGIDLALGSGPVRVTGAAEYHAANYFAQADWNLISAFQHPVSFEHTADGDGVVYSVGADLDVGPRSAISLAGDYSFWRAENGTDRTFLSAGGSTTQGLNEVEWESYSVNLGFTYRF